MQDLIDHHKHGSDYMAIAMSSLPSSMTSSSTSASPQVPCTKCPQLRADIKDPQATLGSRHVQIAALGGTVRRSARPNDNRGGGSGNAGGNGGGAGSGRGRGSDSGIRG